MNEKPTIIDIRGVFQKEAEKDGTIYHNIIIIKNNVLEDNIMLL